MISVLLTAFNRANLLDWQFFSISKQQLPKEYEIIVLNDSLDDDGTKEVCNKWSNTLNVKYVFTGQRNTKEKSIWRSAGVSLNIGSKIAKYDTIIIGCAEIFHLGNTLLELCNNVNPKLLVSFEGYDDMDACFLNSLQKNTTLVFPRFKLNTKLPFFMSMDKKTYIDIGGYDEDFLVGAGYDDDDIVHRMELCECKFKIINNIKIVHLYHSRKKFTKEEHIQKYSHNEKLFNDKKGIIKRNENKLWGQINS